MPSQAIRRILLGLGVAGVLAFCSGCSFFINNQIATGRLLLIAANVLLVPLFLYLIVLRSRAGAEYKRRQRKREQQAQRELAALSAADEILKSNTNPTKPEDV